MSGLQNTIYFLIFLGVLVTVHELGHFLAAKWANVKVLKFSIGFGPKVFGFRRGETEYQIAALPLGGFVAMAGQYPGEDLDEVDQNRTFLGAPWWKRMIILAAGPGFNLIFPVLAYFVVFMGDHKMMAARIQWVEPASPAAVAGLQPGDLIKKIDGRTVRAFQEIAPALENLFERPIPLVVERDGRELTLQVTPTKHVDKNPIEKIQRGMLGVGAVAPPAIVGVPAGSPAEVAGLKTFDRILSVNGEAVRDFVHLGKVLDAATSPVSVVAIRSRQQDVGRATLIMPSTLTATIEKGQGSGLDSIGLESADLYVWTVFANSPAARAGLSFGDRLVSINGKELTSWAMAKNLLQTFDTSSFELSWRAGAELKQLKLSQASEDVFDELKNKSEVTELGVRPRLASQGQDEVLAAGAVFDTIVIHMGPVDAAYESVSRVPDAVRQIALVIGKLFTRDIPLESVGGPILLFQVAAKSAEAGYQTFLGNMAVVSVNLALVNLLPVPILDGFGLLAAAWEGIRRRPIPTRAREVANMVGFAVLALLVVLVFKNDITKLLR